MADLSADTIRLNGADVAQNPQALDFTTGMNVTESGGIATIKLKDSYAPSHVVKFAGITASETDSDASVVASVTGVASTDVVVASILAQAGTASLLKAVPTTNTLTFTLSGNGGAGTRIQYAIFRAV